MLALEWTRENIKVLQLEHDQERIQVSETRVLPAAEFPAWIAKRRNQEVRVCAAFDKWVHKALLLPPVKNAIHDMVVREAQQLLGTVPEASFEEMGLEEEGGERRVRVMVGAVPRDEMEEIATFFRDAGVEPSLITTTAFSIRALLEAAGELRGAPIAFMEFESDKSAMYVFMGAEVRVIRNLPYTSALTFEELPRMVRDVKQTFFFHTTNFRGEPVRKLVFTGVEPARMAGLTQDLEVEVSPLGLSPLVRGAGKQTLCSAALGLAFVNAKAFRHNLLPPSIRENRSVRKTIRVLSLSLCVLVLAFAMPGAWLTRESHRRQTLEKSTSGRIQSVEAHLRTFPKEMVAYEVAVTQPPWEQFFRELTAIAPDGVVLRGFAVKRNGNQWRGTASGETYHPGQIEGLMLVETLKARLRRSPLFVGAAVKPKLEPESVKFEITFSLPSRGGAV